MILVMENDPATADLEKKIRSQLATTKQRLAALRRERVDLDANVRDLVALELTQSRLVAVYDKAAAKKAKKLAAVDSVKQSA